MSDLTALPDTIASGTTVLYTKSFADYRADDSWTMALHIAGRHVLSINASANGAAFDIALPFTQTATLFAGVYQWSERVTKAGQVFDAERGTVTVFPNIVDALPGDLQSWEEKTLEVVESALSGQLGDSIASYQIAGRQVDKIPMRDLLELRSMLITKVNQDKAGGAATTPIRVQFTGTVNE